MRIVYMGTPDFAVPALESLYDAGHDVVAVVTKVDARRDRGKKVVVSPVKAKATELGITVLQPEKIKGNDAFIEEIAGLSPDVIVVAAYGMILPAEVLKIPEYGCINIHGSLLPRHRGAAPIQAAILDGDKETGITIMQMDEGLDTGDMLLKRSTPIGDKNCGMLHDELSLMGAELICDALENIDSIEPKRQNDEESTYAPMIKKEDGKADFTRSPEQFERQIRAYDPWPGTTTSLNGDLMKIWKASPLNETCDSAPGTVMRTGDEGIDVSCGGRMIRIENLQMAGRKRVTAAEYLRGKTIEIGTILG